MDNPRRYRKYVPYTGVAGGGVTGTTGVKEATHLEVAVFYSKGGINYATYKNEPAGYWASVTPVTVEKTAGGFESVSFTLFSGLKFFLKPGARFSSKTLKELGLKVFAEAPGVGAAYDRGDKDAAHRLIHALADPEPAVAS